MTICPEARCTGCGACQSACPADCITLALNRAGDRVAVIDNSRIAEEGRVSEVFTNPQSDIARDLILPQDRAALDTAGGRRIRLTFDGLYSQAPIISQLVLDCQAPVNILFADTKEYEGVIYGHMIIELPTDERQADKIIAWLSNSQVGWKEEK